MKWIADIALPKPMHFVIEQQKLTSLMPGVPDQFGYYLFVFENGRDLYDYMQDELEIAIDFAFSKFGVPKEAWRQVE